MATTPPVYGSGDIVAASQAARANSSNTQIPELQDTILVPTPLPTNADRFTANDDAGVDAPVRNISLLQSTPPMSSDFSIPPPSQLPGAGTEYNANELNPTESTTDGWYAEGSSATPTNTTGAGAANEDSADKNISPTADSPTGSNEVVTLANQTGRAVKPRANILDQAASYTYSISIYLMSPEDYRKMLTSKKRYIGTNTLLMQSAGAPLSSNIVGGQLNEFDPGTLSAIQGRNQYFPLDYYIDDVEIKTFCPGKGTGGAHNVAELKFKIIEPNGISLLDNLYKASREYNSGGGGTNSVNGSGTQGTNYGAENYLMAIRFYGYDENGKLITPPASYNDPYGKTDASALVEKLIPFQFTGIKFRVQNKLTEYTCNCVCPQNVIATSQGRGTIPYNIELTATTLDKLFSGNLSYTTAQTTQQTDRDTQQTNTPPDNAGNAPTTTLISGLTQALNKYQAELVTQGVQDVADVYKVVISHPQIANASIVPPGGQVKQTKPMTNATTAAEAKDGEKQSVDNRAKTVSAVAGTSIVQFLDLAIRSSDYIYKQQTKIIDKDNKDVPQSTSGNVFAWYKIGVQAKPLKKDPKRRDYAYEITYEIAPYGVNDMKSEYFPQGRFRGVQKKYSYWFTGENTSVLNFEQDFDYAYYSTINTKTKAKSLKNNMDYREVEKRLFAPNSPQSSQGMPDDQNEPGANAADYLYSVSNQGQCKITIVGDPAWIQQGELWSGIRSTTTNSDQSYDAFFDAWLPDGTINFDAREALFEIAWQKPTDYNIQTGLMNGAEQQTPSQSYIYKSTFVTSHFSKGKFTQELEGALLLFPDSVVTTTQILAAADQAASSGSQPDATESRDAPDESAAETARLERLNSAGASNNILSAPTVAATDPIGTDDASLILAVAGPENKLTPPPTSNDPVAVDALGNITGYNDGLVREP